MKTRIHINRHVIAANRKHGRSDPAITVKTSKTNRRAHEVVIHGPSKVVYRPHKPLSCGAVAWVETEALVDIIN